MRISEAKPKGGLDILPGSDFVDAWRVEGLPVGESAEMIASRIPYATPSWARLLLTVRNILVAPFGLKTGREVVEHGRPSFPVLSSHPDRVVLGLNDRHLDFRLVIDVEPNGRRDLSAVATTYVRTHGRAGKFYLALVKPFHRLIVPAMLKNAAAASG